MMHETGPSNQPPSPDARFFQDGSLVEIYQVESIISGTTKEQCIYDDNTFEYESGIAWANLKTTRICLPDYDALSMIMTAGLYPSQEKRIVRGTRAYTEQASMEAQGFRARRADSDGDYLLLDTSEGMTVAVCLNEASGQITLTNNFIFGDEEGLTVLVSPEPFDQLDGSQQLQTMARLMVDILGRAGESPSGMRPARAYRIGNNLKGLSPASVAGNVAVAASMQSKEDTPSPREVKKLSDIILDDELDDKLRTIVQSFTRPEFREERGVRRPKGVLIDGEAGTGKTLLAEALANELGAHMKYVLPNDLQDVRSVERLFGELETISQPTAVLLDRLEDMFAAQKDGALQDEVVNRFQIAMSELENSNVLFVATSRNIDDVDTMGGRFVGVDRFNYVLQTPMPNQELRTRMFGEFMAGYILADMSKRRFEADIDLSLLGATSKNLTGDDIREIFRRLGLVHELNESRTDLAKPVTQAEFLGAIKQMRSEKL